MKFSKLVVLGMFLTAGIAFLIGGVSIGGLVRYTSTTEFCISCHEMQANVYQEFKKSAHYVNESGVRATCSDCHVPHDWGDTLKRKVLAAKDVYHHLLGSIDTPEKFESRRLEMAQRVWDSMKASDSRECRNCHRFDAMNFEKQRLRAQKQHQNALNDGRTCIDCHKGIAHKAVHKELDDNTVGENEELILEF